MNAIGQKKTLLYHIIDRYYPEFSEYSMPNKWWEFWIIGVGYLEILILYLLDGVLRESILA